MQPIHQFCTAKKKLARYWAPDISEYFWPRYPKQIEFQEELMIFLTTWPLSNFTLNRKQFL